MSGTVKQFYFCFNWVHSETAEPQRKAQWFPLFHKQLSCFKLHLKSKLGVILRIAIQNIFLSCNRKDKTVISNSRANILLPLQRVFHVSDAIETYMYMPLYSLDSCLLHLEVNRKLTCTTGGTDWTKELTFRFLNVYKFNTGKFTFDVILCYWL